MLQHWVLSSPAAMGNWSKQVRGWRWWAHRARAGDNLCAELDPGWCWGCELLEFTPVFPHVLKISNRSLALLCLA